MKVGTVAMIGKPNVGKSTLVNAIVGHKVSIVSDKPQTTRKSVLGVYRNEDAEIVFIDTPGVHEPHTRLGRMMVDATRQSLGDVDLVMFVGDVSRKPNEDDERIAKLLSGDFPIFLCLNKMDQLKPELVVPHVEAYCKLLGSDQYMLTTAIEGRNLDLVVQEILNRLPEGEPRFDEDTYTDQTLRFMAAELIREKVLIATRQEVPHATTVNVTDWDEEEDGSITIRAEIIVEKSGQRAIIIGKQGSFLKEVGTKSRAEIEALTGTPVYLDLFVKVEENWRQNPRLLHELEMDA
jgi:GTPase